MGKLSLDYKDFEEVTLGKGYELGNKYYQNEVLSYVVDSGGNIIGISIWEKSLRKSGFSDIKSIKIGFGEVNVWLTAEAYKCKDLEGLYKVVNDILVVILGEDSTEYLLNECGYQITIE